MDAIKSIVINKNRGWRGLAEVVCRDTDYHTVSSMIFSFSQEVWDDMLAGIMVLQSPGSYIIVHFDNLDKLPKGQRSVLLKSFTANVTEVKVIPKTSPWVSFPGITIAERNAIFHFCRNRNNHTTSDWNCIGIRVTPMI